MYITFGQTANIISHYVPSSGISVIEEHQLLLQAIVDENDETIKSKMKRKIRSLKNEVESRIRDYNGALTTFASDLRILRQEVQQNVGNIQTSMAVETRKVSDELHILETKCNTTSDQAKENLYYVAKAQQQQMGNKLWSFSGFHGFVGD